MMNKIRFNHERFNKDMKRVTAILTVVTNCFIIAGVSRHWNYHDNTKLATPQQETTEVQPEASYGTGRPQAYQNAN